MKKETIEENVIQSKKAAPPKSIFFEYLESFVVTLIMAIFGMTFIIQAVTVPTGSMQNTILIGDYLLVNKFIFNAGGNPLWFLPQREIRRGDIIVFKYPGNRADPDADAKNGHTPFQMNYVKRVIGLPGEIVEFRNNQVFINGTLLEEKREIGESNDRASALETKEFETAPKNAKYQVYYDAYTTAQTQSGKNLSTERYNFAVEGKPMKVPDDSYFAMGDSRDNSLDSRVWGFVPRNLIVGRALFVYWSCDRGASNGSVIGCITNPRLSRIGTLIR